MVKLKFLLRNLIEKRRCVRSAYRSCRRKPKAKRCSDQEGEMLVYLVNLCNEISAIEQSIEAEQGSDSSE